MSDRRDQINELLDSLGADVDLSSDKVDVEGELEESSDLPDFVDVASTSVSTAVGVHPKDFDGLDDISREFLLDDGSRVDIELKRRPECPSCSFLWGSSEDIYNHKFEECSECGDLLCEKCWNSCSACGTVLCSGCTQGHGSVDETYCPICRRDVQDQVEHERELDKREQSRLERQDLIDAKLEARQQSHNEEMDVLDRRLEERENERSFELSKEDKALERRKQRHSEKMDELEQELDEWERRKQLDDDLRQSEHDRLMDKFEAKLEEWKSKKEFSHQQDMDKLDKMIALAEMINEADDTEGIRNRLTGEKDQFSELGSQFSGMNLEEDGSDDGGYDYSEVFD